MKLTIELEDENAGRGLFYWILVRSGCKSIPLQQPSQWFYEVGKALYEMSDEEATQALRALRDTQAVTVSTKKETYNVHI